VQQLGPRGFERVVVLVPGTNGGAGGITPVALDIVRRVPRTQVWIVDRRQQAFEDIEQPTVIQDRHASHLDPISAAPGRNRFLKTVVPFLRRIAR
jgi:hypothetical protein